MLASLVLEDACTRIRVHVEVGKDHSMRHGIHLVPEGTTVCHPRYEPLSTVRYPTALSVLEYKPRKRSDCSAHQVHDMFVDESVDAIVR